MSSLRTKCLSTKVTAEDYAAFETMAGEQRVSAWARDVLLHAATAQPIELLILAEFIALRIIVLNLQYDLVRGEPPTLEAMKRLIELADRDKVAKAHERLRSAAARGPR